MRVRVRVGAELRLGEPRDDLGEQERQAVRVALDPDGSALDVLLTVVRPATCAWYERSLP